MWLRRNQDFYLFTLRNQKTIHQAGIRPPVRNGVASQADNVGNIVNVDDVEELDLRSSASAGVGRVVAELGFHLRNRRLSRYLHRHLNRRLYLLARRRVPPAGLDVPPDERELAHNARVQSREEEMQVRVLNGVVGDGEPDA